MAEVDPSVLDPSPFDPFPQFDPQTDLSFFPDCEFPLPDGLASDLDLDDIDLDFSVDDLLLSSSSDDGSPPHPNSDLNPTSSDLTSNSNSNSNSPSPEIGNSSSASGVMDRKEAKHEGDKNWRLKRKNDSDDDGLGNPNPNVSPNPNLRTVKFRRSDEANSPNSSSCTFSMGSDEDEKRKARLMRNRESAQLSRQRKKYYVEELEEKVRALNATIADLNGKISFYMAENARLHQQLNGNGGNGGNPVAASAVYPPHPPPLHFPWIPYAAGYPLRPNGAPAIPIPRLKPQQPASAPKARKSSENKKKESKTKKVASVSFLGLLFVMLVFGGVMNFGFGGGSGDKVNGRILSVRGRGGNGLNNTEGLGLCGGKNKMVINNRVGNNRCQKGMAGSEGKQNSSESLPALLYVPRNGKHVEINGNLIIHSVLASERAMAQAKSNGQGRQSSGKEGTGLVIPSNVASALAVPKSGREVGRQSKTYRNSAEHPRALASDSHEVYRDNIKSSMADGPLQQWFREGLAGPILSSGTCTEVFQFEVSPASASPRGGIIPASSVVNVTDNLPPMKGKNRRILYSQPIPFNGSTLNNTQHFGKPTESSSTIHGNNIVPSMVVSVMADPREAGDGDGDGMIAPKSLSRIFVVVLTDSIKYATYSCMLPLKSHGPHLVN